MRWLLLRRMRLLLLGLLAATFAMPARAHVGSKDVFEQMTAGPYQLFVTIRAPDVIPGVAMVEVRTSGRSVTALRVTPTPLTGEAAAHPPTADTMQRSLEDPGFYTGSLWLMAPGSWQVHFQVEGAGGHAEASVPVPAVPLAILPMSRALGSLLGILGVVLVAGLVGIVAAAMRESRLPPGVALTPVQLRRARLGAGVAALLVLGTVALGGWWWHAEAAGYARAIYRPMHLAPKLVGNTLDLRISEEPDRTGKTHEAQRGGRFRSNADLIPDHGHIMHLYAIRQPEMDAVFHLHPVLVSPGDLRMQLPPMPAGIYALYGDIVHANGFPETLTASLVVPSGLSSAPLAAEDASAAPPPLSKGELGASYRLPDGYTMVWERPAALTAKTAYTFQFRLLDPSGRPATNMQPYLGMAGHAAFVKADGTTFAHTHPNGSAARAAVMLANGESPEGDMSSMTGMEMPSSPPISPEVGFPYGFPAPGRYRIFIQMKHAGTVETGVFDAEVGP
jgi:hypothetical protein